MIKGLTFRYICAIIVILLAKYEIYSVFHLFVLYCDDSNVCKYIYRDTLTPCNRFEKYRPSTEKMTGILICVIKHREKGQTRRTDA